MDTKKNRKNDQTNDLVNDCKTITGTVLEIQRMSTEDGPGIRTTVFMKGCCLKCTWCHNPESISLKPQTLWIDTKCIGCKTCVNTCKQKALTFSKKGILINRGLCKSCGSCAEQCPSTGMELLGKKWTVDNLVNELIKDKVFFEKSKGGVTVSGGESTMQYKFISPLLSKLKEKKIHTALDTCGLCSTKNLDIILPYTDLVLFDLKEIDLVKHKKFTSQDNGKILQQLKYISQYLSNFNRSNIAKKNLWIRTPIIPGATATKENIRGIGKFISENVTYVLKRWELCAFNNLCKDKYTRLGLDWKFADCELLTQEEMETFAKIAKQSGVNPDIVHWTGDTKLEIK